MRTLLGAVRAYEHGRWDLWVVPTPQKPKWAHSRSPAAQQAAHLPKDARVPESIEQPRRSKPDQNAIHSQPESKQNVPALGHDPDLSDQVLSYDG